MKIINFIKAVVLITGTLIIALLVVVLGMPWWGNTKLNRIFIGLFSKFACAVVGIDLQIIDLFKISLRSPAVFIGNHQSMLDMALIGKISPPNVVIVAKKEVIYLPIVGWYFKVAGNLFIDRSDKRDAHERMMGLAETLVKKNLVAAIFPEGTRNRKSNEELLPFKKGAFHIAFSKGLPIVPIVSTNLKGVAVLERLELNGGKVWIKVLDPIETKGIPMSEMNAFMDRVRNLMQSELNTLNAQVKNHA